MLRNTIACCLLALVPGMALMAQNNIPPVFAGDEELFREDILTRTYITPKQVFWTSSATSVRDAQLLLKPNTGQSDIFASGMCQLVNKGSDKASVILDFGKEIHGGLKIVISTVSPARTPVFRVRFGESVSETCSELNTTTSLVETGSNEVMDLKNNTATNDHAMRDMELTCPYYGSIEIGSTGYRFVRLDLLTDDMLVNLKEVTAILRYRDIPYEGSFNCSDQRLNDIWMTGAYTVHLNMQEYIWDGIKRDRLIWLGDMHPETSTISYVFGEDESVYSSLDLAVKQYPLPNYFNGMSAYSMWYLIMQYDWYMHFGNIDFLRKHGDYIKGLVDLIDTKVDAEGNDELGGGRFLDWPSSPNEKGVHSGYRALIVWAMNDAAKLCRILGDEPQAKKAEAIVARLNQKIMPSNNLKQAEGLMAIAGLKSAEDAAKAILEGGPKGFSTFYGYYMLQALAMDGKYAEALDIISKFWGGMLDLGATTFWEDFNLDWVDNVGRIDGDFGAYCYPGFRHSFCHGWASGPTAWMSQHVLGIEPLEPGCRKVSVKPHLGNLEWAEGTYPTPMGNIYVKHVRQADGSVKSIIKAPKGVKVVK